MSCGTNTADSYHQVGLYVWIVPFPREGAKSSRAARSSPVRVWPASQRSNLIAAAVVRLFTRRGSGWTDRYHLVVRAASLPTIATATSSTGLGEHREAVFTRIFAKMRRP
jgi:hypothetical protein